MSVLVSRPSLVERPEKIHPRHLEQAAVVYIRQSSMQQVHRNQESTQIQYGLVRLAQELGWAPDRITVIDEDLGLSGASAAGRQGFQRLLAEVALDQVGLVVGVEMSRLARSSRDWHQLLELCARFGTLIADLDGIYDPAHYNDRLLLGLKGTMSEAELHILRQRLLEGKLSKARRGALRFPVPTGYLRSESGDVILDPDDEVQLAVRIVFEEFERTMTLHGTLRAVVAREIRLGVRRRVRPNLGDLEWHRPHRGILSNILRNPIYAGAYAYGRRQIDPRRQQPGRPATGRTSLLPPEQWRVLLHDHFPAYITWEQYEQNQQRLKENRERAPSHAAPRNGSALLSGRVVCGPCGYRMTVQYAKSSNGKTYARYVCGHAAASRGDPVCSSLSASPLDEVVAQWAVSALEPAALELSLRASEQIEEDRRKAQDLWRKRLQRARYEAERAERQYQAVEPENRLVARSLERAWEDKLQAERALQDAHTRETSREPAHLTEQEREVIRSLAADLPALWSAPTTTPADRKEILGLLLDRVVVHVDAQSEVVEVAAFWAGGHETRAQVLRPVAKLTTLRRHAELLGEIRRLRREGYSAPEIARTLNQAGWVTPMQRSPFNERLVRAMIHRYGAPPKGPRRPVSNDPNEWRLAELADRLGMPIPTLYGWLRRGWVRARRRDGQHVILADASELERLRRLRRQGPVSGSRQTHASRCRSRPSRKP